MTIGRGMAFRGVLAASAVGLVAVGLALAADGAGAPPASSSPGPAATIAGAATQAAESSAFEAATPTAEPRLVASPPVAARDDPSPAPTAPLLTPQRAQRVEPALATAPPPAAPVAPPAPSAVVTEPPASPLDLPRMTEKAVLAAAAGVRMPTGRTFRECVELPPGGEPWPLAIHLYYAGKGAWVIETHLSEVGLLFDEATETFRVTGFNPPNPGCEA